LQLVAGIAAEIAAGNAYVRRYRYGELEIYHDPYYLLFGIFILLESGFLWPSVILSHGKWISKTLKEEKIRNLIENGDLYCRMAGQPGQIQYRPID
jgi:hypothetical protein